MTEQIIKYQKKCFAEYKTLIGYPSNYSYLCGNPINVLVPIETPVNKYMVVGAYPSAKFFTIDGVADTPMMDNDSPFSNESYFDGSRVRTIPSGKELNEVILEQIGISREDCWITDLVKVFLFKEGHINRYIKHGRTDMTENRSLFNDYAKESLSWLEKEIELCNPKLIILLGIEVVQNVFNISSAEAKSYLTGELKKKEILGQTQNYICLPHPGILMKQMPQNNWPKRFKEEISINAKNTIKALT